MLFMSAENTSQLTSATTLISRNQEQRNIHQWAIASHNSMQQRRLHKNSTPVINSLCPKIITTSLSSI